MLEYYGFVVGILFLRNNGAGHRASMERTRGELAVRGHDLGLLQDCPLRPASFYCP